MDQITGKREILLVEDSADDQVLVRRALRVYPEVNISTASDGQEALDYFASRTELPELVILDLKLPKLDGFDVLRWIRSQPALQELSVVVFSSSDEVHDIELATRYGANGYARKPVDFDEHAKVVCQLVEGFLNLPPWQGEHSGLIG